MVMRIVKVCIVPTTAIILPEGIHMPTPVTIYYRIKKVSGAGRIGIKSFTGSQPGCAMVLRIVEVNVVIPSIAPVRPDNIHITIPIGVYLRIKSVCAMTINPDIISLPGYTVVRRIVVVDIIIPITIVPPDNVYMSVPIRAYLRL